MINASKMNDFILDMTNSKTPKLVAGWWFSETSVFWVPSLVGIWLNWTSVQGFVFHDSFLPCSRFPISRSQPGRGEQKPQPQTNFHKWESRMKATFTRWFNLIQFVPFSFFSLEVNLWRGHLVIPKRASAELPGNFQIYFFKTVLYSSTYSVKRMLFRIPSIRVVKSPVQDSWDLLFWRTSEAETRRDGRVWIHREAICRNTTMTWLSKTRWWFQILYFWNFHLYLGKWSHYDEHITFKWVGSTTK